jgi:hypothetical protein
MIQDAFSFVKASHGMMVKSQFTLIKWKEFVVCFLAQLQGPSPLIAQKYME